MYTGYGVSAATILALVLVLPPLPFYNSHPVKWVQDKKKTN
jgi:hypothetical protein